jgi:hypothetical protein
MNINTIKQIMKILYDYLAWKENIKYKIMKE